MAIVKGNLSQFATTSTSAVSPSWSHTNNGEDVYICLSWRLASLGQTISVTYGGQAMTKVLDIDKNTVGALRLTVWRLQGAPTGANTVQSNISSVAQKRYHSGIGLSISGGQSPWVYGARGKYLSAAGTSISDTGAVNTSGVVLGFGVSPTLLTATGSSQTKQYEAVSSYSRTAYSYDTGVSSPTTQGWSVATSQNMNMAFLSFYEAPSSPDVTTQAATGVAHNSATLNGNITAIGAGNATTRGFYLKEGTTGDPGAGDTIIDEDGDYSTGAYSLGASGLLPETSYRVAAFATNGSGTSAGATVGFTTTEAPPSVGGAGKLGNLGLGLGL